MGKYRWVAEVRHTDLSPWFTVAWTRTRTGALMRAWLHSILYTHDHRGGYRARRVPDRGCVR